MTRVTFVYKDNVPIGFKISGHSTRDCGDIEGKTVCAAVSSAAYMTANALTEIADALCEITESDGYLLLAVKDANEKTELLLKGFILHITGLCKQYPERIKITTEV